MKTIKISLLLLWMGIIFYFSHQPGDTSSESSQMVFEFLNQIGIEIPSILIRKIAHVIEYFILCMLIYNVVKDDMNHSYVISIGFSFFYAVTDELHQMFVPNRGPSFLDVMIDTMGAFFALIAIVLFKMIKKKIK